MESFLTVVGRAAPMPSPNIDTDVIMPKQFLKRIDRFGLSKGLFFDLKILPEGLENPDFILNKPAWRDSKFLVVGPNFGCGSSREHAVWGLKQAGIRALLGTSFSGIFFDNCVRNGLLAASIEHDVLQSLFVYAANVRTNIFRVDLPSQQIILFDSTSVAFSLPTSFKDILMSGLDHIGRTLEHAASIRAFEDDYLCGRPWLR